MPPVKVAGLFNPDTGIVTLQFSSAIIATHALVKLQDNGYVAEYVAPRTVEYRLCDIGDGHMGPQQWAPHSNKE
jgi:hypothetical protein